MSLAAPMVSMADVRCANAQICMAYRGAPRYAEFRYSDKTAEYA